MDQSRMAGKKSAVYLWSMVFSKSRINIYPFVYLLHDTRSTFDDFDGHSTLAYMSFLVSSFI